MNLYVVRTRDKREFIEPIAGYEGWPPGPSYPYQPIAPVLAETRGQAKRYFLDEFSSRPHSGVYDDDWTELRVRTLAKDVSLLPGIAAGVHEEVTSFWAAIPYEEGT